jgi:hypothetical protein
MNDDLWNIQNRDATTFYDFSLFEGSCKIGVSSNACSDGIFEKRNLRCFPALFVSHLTFATFSIFSECISFSPAHSLEENSREGHCLAEESTTENASYRRF